MDDDGKSLEEEPAVRRDSGLVASVVSSNNAPRFSSAGETGRQSETRGGASEDLASDIKGAQIESAHTGGLQSSHDGGTISDYEIFQAVSNYDDLFIGHATMQSSVSARLPNPKEVSLEPNGAVEGIASNNNGLLNTSDVNRILMENHEWQNQQQETTVPVPEHKHEDLGAPKDSLSLPSEDATKAPLIGGAQNEHLDGIPAETGPPDAAFHQVVVLKDGPVKFVAPMLEGKPSLVEVSGELCNTQQAGLTDKTNPTEMPTTRAMQRTSVNEDVAQRPQDEVISCGKQAARLWIPGAHKDEQQKGNTKNCTSADEDSVPVKHQVSETVEMINGVEMSEMVENRDEIAFVTAVKESEVSKFKEQDNSLVVTKTIENSNTLDNKLLERENNQPSNETTKAEVLKDGGMQPSEETTRIGTEETETGKDEVGEYKGRRVRTQFGRKVFIGDVVSYDSENKWYKVLYEDGDEEDLEKSELEAVLLPVDALPVVKSNKRPVTEESGRDATRVKKIKQEGQPKEGKKETLVGSKKPSELADGELSFEWEINKGRKSKGSKGQKAAKVVSLKKALESPLSGKSEFKERRSGSGISLQEGIKRYLQKLGDSGQKFMRKEVKRKECPEENSSPKSKKLKLDDVEGLSSPVRVDINSSKSKKRAVEVANKVKHDSSNGKKSKGRSMEVAKSSNKVKKRIHKSTTLEEPTRNAKRANSEVDGNVEDTNGGTTLVGRPTRKKFNGKFYSGTVVSHDPKTKFYKVRYEDSDEEDLEWSELEPTLLSEVNQDTPVKSNPSKRSEVMLDQSKVRSRQLGSVLVGRPIRKKFNKKFYSGNVVSYDKKRKLYKVSYEDGDEEDLEWEELETILVPEGERGSTLIGSSTRKKFGRKSYTGSVVSYNKKKKLYKVVYEDGIGEKLKWSELEPTLLSERKQIENASESRELPTRVVGRRMKKKFGGDYYYGVVLGYDKKTSFYRVRYDDGDEEDLEWIELEPTLLVEQNQERLVTESNEVGATLIGRSTRKKFGRKFYTGTVQSYDDKTSSYRVRYEDGDEEELEWSELEPVLLAEGREDKHASKSDNELGASLIGRATRKKFGKKFYRGTVFGFDSKTSFYKVRYEDGDEENLEWSELEPTLLAEEREKKHATKSGNELGASLIGRATRKKFGKKFYMGTVLGFDSKKLFYEVRYEDGDAEDLEWSELEPTLLAEEREDKHAIKSDNELGASLIGRATMKKFGKKLYRGTVLSFDPKSSFFKVRYEDGDEEDLERSELEPTLLVERNEEKHATKNENGMGAVLVGRATRKRFGKKFYRGRVVSFDSHTSFYKVRYEDGDEEDLEWTELEPTLLPERNEDKSANDDYNGMGAGLVGRPIRKKFGKRFYRGRVVSFDSQTSSYKVRYEDGDEEDLEWSELEPILLPKENGDVPVVESGDIGAALVGRSTRKKFKGKPFAGTVVSYYKKTAVYKVIYENGDEEELEWDDLEPTLIPERKQYSPPKASAKKRSKQRP